MNQAGQNLVLLFHYSEVSFTEELFIRTLIADAVSPQHFCTAHELAAGNRISRKKYKLLRAYRSRKLPHFNFLINRN
jgi:hypothetical protein